MLRHSTASPVTFSLPDLAAGNRLRRHARIGGMKDRKGDQTRLRDNPSMALAIPFPPILGTIACQCVISGSLPVTFLSHAGGDWQVYCSDRNHDFDGEAALQRDMRLVPINHLVDRDPRLCELDDLPVDMAAERVELGGAWTRCRNEDGT
jgi:hypothetical protein